MRPTHLTQQRERTGFAAGAFAVLAVILLCPSEHRADSGPYPRRVLKQGWTSGERQQFYFTSQGSQIIPYDWYLALEQPHCDKPFNEPAFIDRLRFLPMPRDRDRNPDGLPVGFVKDDNRETVQVKLKRLAKGVDKTHYPQAEKWLGLTCSACHTSQADYKGKSFIIDGGPGQGDFQRLLELMVEALQATLDSDKKMERFARKILAPGSGGGEKAALRKRVEAFLLDLREEVRRNGTGDNPKHRYGFARLDAFGRILNNVCASATKIPKNAQEANAPVSYPFLWDIPMLDWVQWNGAASNPLTRNIGEVLGVFAQLELDADPKEDLFKSSANLRTLGRLEALLRTLRAPPWPSELLGKPEAAKVAAGKVLFANYCVHCHGVRGADGEFPKAGKNPDGPDLIAITMVPLEKIGTDPRMAKNFLERRVDPGPLKDILPTGVIGPDGKVPAVVFLTAAVQGVTARKIKEAGPRFTPEMKRELEGNRPTKQPDLKHLAGYKARPLNGIWATAPYLHNGSVPNLDQLLRPVKDRSKKFYVGSREFDTKLVGYSFKKAEGMFEFDTSVPGNWNTGHEGPMYTQTRGCDRDPPRDFTREEREALIEYMKTLE